MIEYRTFANRDPARMAALWNGMPLGRGAATGIGVDAFETLNFAQPYFDRKGVILAFDGAELVGFVHAGFGANAEETTLSYDAGVICALIVHPNYRRQGIGRELLRRAETYLREKGTKNVPGGPQRAARSLLLRAVWREPAVGLYGVRSRCGPFLHWRSVINPANAPPSCSAT